MGEGGVKERESERECGMGRTTFAEEGIFCIERRQSVILRGSCTLWIRVCLGICTRLLEPLILHMLVCDSWSSVHPISCCWYGIGYNDNQLSKMCKKEGSKGYSQEYCNLSQIVEEETSIQSAYVCLVSGPSHVECGILQIQNQYSFPPNSLSWASSPRVHGWKSTPMLTESNIVPILKSVRNKHITAVFWRPISSNRQVPSQPDIWNFS